MRSQILVTSTIAFLVILQISAPFVFGSPLLAMNVSLQYPYIYQGESVQMYVVLSNVGSDTASNIRVTLVNLPAGLIADSIKKDAGSLSAQAPPARVTFVIQSPKSISPSSYQITVQVSADNAPSASGFATLLVKENPISISVFAPSVSVIQIDKPQTFNLSATVNNIGNTPIENPNLALVVDPSAFKILTSPPQISYIGPKSLQNVAWSLRSLVVSEPGYRDITLSITFQMSDSREHVSSASTSVFFRHWYDPANFGCLIVTATYDSEFSPQVQFLRAFRDNFVLTTYAGSRFMLVFNAWYYSFSPFVAEVIAYHDQLRTLMKLLLSPLIGILQLGGGISNLLSETHEAAIILTGAVMASMLGVVYGSIPVAVIIGSWRRLRRFAQRAEIPLTCSAVLGLTGVFFAELLRIDALMLFSTSAMVLAILVVSALLSGRLLCQLLESLTRLVLRMLHWQFANMRT